MKHVIPIDRLVKQWVDGLIGQGCEVQVHLAYIQGTSLIVEATVKPPPIEFIQCTVTLDAKPE